MGFIDREQLRIALDRQAKSGKRLGKILVESGLITEDRLVHALSRQLSIEACDPIMTPIHDSVLALVPPEVAFTHRVLPVARQREAERESLYVATADPLDSPAQVALADLLPSTTELRWMLAGETEMDLALARHYGAAPPNFVDPESVTDLPGAGGNAEPLQSTGDILSALREAVELSKDIPPKPPGASSLPGDGVEGSEAGAVERLPGVLSDDLAQQISEVEAILEARPDPKPPKPRAGWSTDAALEAPNANGSAPCAGNGEAEPGVDQDWAHMLERPGLAAVDGAGPAELQSNLSSSISVPVASAVRGLDLGGLAAEARVLPVADPGLGLHRPSASLKSGAGRKAEWSPGAEEDANETEGLGATPVLREVLGDAPATLVVPDRAAQLHAAIVRFVAGESPDEATREDVLRVVAACLLHRGDLSVGMLRTLLAGEADTDRPERS